MMEVGKKEKINGTRANEDFMYFNSLWDFLCESHSITTKYHISVLPRNNFRNCKFLRSSMHLYHRGNPIYKRLDWYL